MDVFTCACVFFDERIALFRQHMFVFSVVLKWEKVSTLMAACFCQCAEAIGCFINFHDRNSAQIIRIHYVIVQYTCVYVCVRVCVCVAFAWVR